MATVPAPSADERPVRRPLTVRVTVNPVDPAASRAAAREDREHDADRYDHDDTEDE
jgi:hypothetical protein